MEENNTVSRAEFEALAKDYSELMGHVLVLHREAAARGWDLNPEPQHVGGEPPAEPSEAPATEPA